MKKQSQSNRTPSPPKSTKVPLDKGQKGKKVQQNEEKSPKKSSINQSQTPKAPAVMSNEPPKVIKGILKKPKPENEVQASDVVSEISRSQLGKSVSHSNQTKSQVMNDKQSTLTPISSISTYQQLNQQHLSTQNVDAAFIEYLKVQEEMASKGEIDEAVKNLQEGLNERLGLYPAKDQGVWLLSKLLAEIGIRMAVRSLNSDKLDKANQFLKMARKHTEPLPNSDWNESQDWMLTRKNVFKNLALYQQKKEEWEKALDCFKVALKLEKDLKESTANTSLTCAVILSKLNKYAESIDHAQSCMHAIESQLGIDRSKPLAEYKQFDNKYSQEYDKAMTTYAISLHLLGKNLANLKYVKEAKVYLSKAQYVAINMLSKPKSDLQLAISNDLNNLNKNYKQALASTKHKSAEDIETSLVTIKTNLANSSYSQADQQEQKALIGTVTNGPPIKTVKKDDDKNKKKKKKKGEDEAIDAEEDDDNKVFDFVKRFADEKRKKDNDQLEEYHKRVKQDFDEKQKEFMLKQQKQRFSKAETDPKKAQFKANGQFPEKEKVLDKKIEMTKNLSKLAQPRDRQKVKKAGEEEKDLQKEEEERLQRIKKSSLNPAAEGAKLDRKGIKYSSEKGNKIFFDKRKTNIERVNERLGLGTAQEGQDDSMEEVKGGTGDDEEAKRFDMSLPAIKGYKIDSLGLGTAGERVLQKYEGYQSDQSQQERSKRLINMQDPSTKRLLQTLEGSYRKSLPSSLKKEYQEDKDDSDKEEEEKEVNPARDADGKIRDVPKYKPPKGKDWRSKAHSDSDDELPDAKKAMEKISREEGKSIAIEDPSQKLSITEGDQTKYEDHKKDPIPAPQIEQIKQAQQTKPVGPPEDPKKKSQRSTVLSKPPKAVVGTSSEAPKKKEEEKKVKYETVKSRMSGNLGKALGMTGKGSPRPTEEQTKEKMDSTQNESGINDKSQKNQRGSLRGKSVGQKQPSQSKNQQYASPAEKRKAKSKEPNMPWGGPDSDEARQKRVQNQERLIQLSQPRPKTYVLVKEDEDEDEEENLTIRQFRDQVEKGKDINFSDYVAREVPYIKNNVKGFDAKGQPIGTFDTKMNNKSGLFSNIGDKEKNQNQKDLGEVKYIQDKKPRKTIHDKTLQGLTKKLAAGRHTMDDIHVPEYLRKAHGQGGEEGGKNDKRLVGKKLSNMPGMRSLAAKSVYAIGTGQGNLSLKELREMEFSASQYIQKIVRGYFARKWYLNYKVRQRLGVPFSGLEFSQNPFLRLFNKPNQELHAAAMLPPTLVDVVFQQSSQKNMIQKKFKHTKYKKEKDNDGASDVEDAKLDLPDPTEEVVAKKEAVKVVPKRIPKGATTEQLLNNLEKNFLAQGLDAYAQFKRLGAGIEHDDQGKEIDKKVQTTNKPDDLDELRQQEMKLPKWRDQGPNGGFLDVQEVDQYIQKTQKSKGAKKDGEVKKVDKMQDKQNFIGSLAAFAQIHGVFKKPVDGHKKEASLEEEEEGDDIQTLLKKRRQIDEDDDFFPIDRYQDFSREVISFYKKIGNHYIKWTIYAGVAFKKDKKYFMPVKILGEPMQSRNTIVTYLMNLEILKISKDIDKNFEFETIWPFILYLFNNWVRHQVKLMGLMEQRPELKGIFSQSEAAMYEVKEFDKTFTEAKEEYNDLLNFSSEIEFDDRFDMEKYQNENHPDKLLDRSKPKELRKNPIKQLKHNRNQLFNSYKQKINIYEQLLQMEDDDKAIMDYDEKGKLKKKVRLQLDNIFEPVETRKKNPFDYFLKMHFVPLPRTDKGQYKLMQNLQASGYAEILKKNGLNEDNMAIMNEERRKRKGLPPLTILDYNSIDRAALKLKSIIECLFLRRQLNGWCLIPRDVKESLKAKEWQLRKEKNRAIACKMQGLSQLLMKHFGMHIEMPKQYNERAIQIEHSMQKIKEFKSRKQISVADVDQDDYEEQDQHETHNKTNRFKDLDDEVLLRQSNYEDKLSSRENLDQKVKQKMKALGHGPQEDKDDQDMASKMENDAIGKLMDMQKNHEEVEDYLRENEILEQGIILVEESQYIMTLIFRRIESNYENMRAIIDERVRRFTKDDEEEEDQDEKRKQEIMKSRTCEFVSIHPQVIRFDLQNHNDIKEMEKIDIEQEKFMKKKTFYRSYAEIKICSRINRTNWDDSFNVNWETIEEFFQKFSLQWKPEEFLYRRRLNDRERFTFYNFFAKFLFIQDCRVHIDINRFDAEAFKFDHIYLNLDQIKRDKEKHGIFFYYDDYLTLDKNFEESKHDYAIFPFYEDPRLVEHLMPFDKEDVYYRYEPVYEDQMGQSATIQIVEQQKKPDLLIDEETKKYINDEKNNFNLTLSKFPDSDGIYLGKIMITGNEGFKNAYNLRIDYYVVGNTKTLQIKAFNTIYPDVYDLKITHQKSIKDVIRICNQSQVSMVINQIQSMMSISRKLNGSYLKLNFNIRRDKNINLGQNYINMLICNENLLRTMQKDNYRQFQGIVFFENFGGRMLVTVTEFQIEVEQMSQSGTDLQIIHGNKHLPIDQLRQQNDKNRNQNLLVPKKMFQKLRLWKINIFNIFTSKNYDAVVSYDDLINYYESELFQFYSKNPNMVKPNLVYLLQDYIRNLFIYKSRVGSILYWKLPYFKRPLDEHGMYKNVTGDQLYQLKLLNIYHTLQKRIEEQNRDDDNNALPFSLDQMKAKRSSKEPPSLSLRNKLILEKELPIYNAKDSRILKLTSSNQEVIVQVPKVFKSLLSIQYCVITVTLYPLMECWMWQIYFLKTQRTYSVTFYPSDLFNMDQEILNYSHLHQAKSSAQGLWTELIRRSDLMQNPSGDILLVCETFREPLKEILFQDHVFNENALDIFFMEVTLKSYSNYVTDVRYAIYPMDLETDEVNDYTVSIRAFSLTRNIWVKDFQPLQEVVRILKAEKYLTANVKLLYYSMLRDAATLLAHKIVFSEEAKTTEIKKKKLTYDIKQLLNNMDIFQKLQEDARDQPHPDKKKRKDKQARKDDSPFRNKKNDDTQEFVDKEPGLRADWQNQIELNKIIFQGVASQNPIQMYTIIYNDVKDVFLYKLYRASDSSTYEKRIPGHEISKSCAPNYQIMLKQKMASELGERIGMFYKTNMLVASLMSYYNLRK